MRLLKLLAQAGAMELESTELRFETAAEGGTEMHSKEAVPMMAVVAEMMIFANSAVAKRVMQAFPSHALLRRHQPPQMEAFAEVKFAILVNANAKQKETSLWST